METAIPRLSGALQPATDDLVCLRTGIVNVALFGPPGAGDRGWVLVDTGLPGFAHTIVRTAAERFGDGARPAAIVLTHGHFDHVSNARSLAETWDVDVWAHPLEAPYLDGRAAYPPPDPTVGGGLMALSSVLYPRGPFDLGRRLRMLPADGSVPGMPGWRWLPTPGHAPGHVSLFRESDRTLIVGDAFVATKQESALAVATQRRELHGPPMYYTPDWESARRSVETLAVLDPAVALTGHGVPLRGAELSEGLRALARDFRHLAVPGHGRYVGHPAQTDADGIVSLPPRPAYDPLLLAGAAAALGLGVWALRRAR